MKEEQKKNTALKEKAEKLITQHVYASMGIALVPVPFLDFAGLSAIQLNLLRKLSHEYKVPFSKEMVNNLIAALIGGAAPTSFGRYFFSIMKAVPFIGIPAGIVGSSILGGSSTYAVGKVFKRHFEEGGTFLTFDPEKAKAFYANMFEKGKNVAAKGG
jgi:uncharacterized protein (DUF697 family)